MAASSTRQIMPLRETTTSNALAFNRSNDVKGSNSSDQIKKLEKNIISHRAVSSRKNNINLQKPLFHRSLLRPLDSLNRKPYLTVVFDLDETLVNNRRVDIPNAILRPYALHVLNAMRQMENIEIVLWTASTKETGAPVLRQLQDRGLVFDEVIFRNDAWFTEPIHTKDLRLLGRDLDRVVVFDNAPNCCKLNPANAVLVEDFHGNPDEQGRHDGSLVNLYYIVETLRSNCAKGRTVPETLHQLQLEGQLCRPVFYALPEAWQELNLRDFSPLMIPPHGKYLRIVFESAAPLDAWTI